MGARIPLPDGRKVPVSEEYALRYKAMDAQQRKAEFPALIRQADQQGLQAPGQEPPPAEQAPAVEQPPTAGEQPPAAQPPATSGVSTGEDVVRSFGAGGRRGLESIAATPQDLVSLGGRAYSWLRGKQYKDSDYDIPFLPSSEDIHQFTTDVGVGESYVPQTTAGKFASSVGEFAGGSVGPGMITSPGRALIRAGTTALGGGIASEAAGELAEGSKYEELARLAAGVAGAGAGGAGHGAGTHIVEAPGRRIEQAVEDAAAQHGVKLTEGQRTGDVVQQQKEEQMLHGSRGTLAQRALEQRQRANLEATKDASLKLQDRVAPSRGTLPVDSAAELNRSTRTRAEQLRTQGGAGIEKALKEGGVVINADDLRSLPEEIRQKLTGGDLDLPEHTLDDLTPVSNNAMARLDKFAKTYDDPAKFSELSLQKVDRLRRQVIDLTKDVKPKSTDATALSAIIEHFDNWLLDATGRGSIKQGPNVQGGRTASQVAADLKASQQTYKEGSRISNPRGADAKEVGAGDVADIADRGQHAQDTAQLFKPNDSGYVSGAALDAIERIKAVGGTPADLDQIRGIVTDQLLNGPPGKVASRINTFITKNPEVAAHLFTVDQLDDLKNLGTTNRAQVPDPKATNPSRSSYPIVKEMGKQGLRGIPGINVVTEAITEGKGYLAARRALEEANRDTLAREAVKGASKGIARATPALASGGVTVTINDPGDPHNGEKVTVISEGKDGFKVRLSTGQERVIGKRLVAPNG